MSASHEYPKRQLHLEPFSNQFELIEKAALSGSKNSSLNTYGKYSHHNNRYALATVAAAAAVQHSQLQNQYGVLGQQLLQQLQVQTQYAVPNSQSNAVSQASFHSLALGPQAQPMSGSIPTLYYSPTGSQFSQSQLQMMQPLPSSNNTNLSQIYDQISPSPSSLLSESMSKDFSKFNESAQSLNSPTTFNYPLDYNNAQVNESLSFNLNLDTANWADKSSIWNKDTEKTNIW